MAEGKRAFVFHYTGSIHHFKLITFLQIQYYYKYRCMCGGMGAVTQYILLMKMGNFACKTKIPRN